MNIQQIPSNLYAYIAGGSCLCVGYSWCVEKTWLFTDVRHDCFYTGFTYDSSECDDVISNITNPIGCSDESRNGISRHECYTGTGKKIEMILAQCKHVSYCQN